MNQLPIESDKLPVLIVGAGPTGLMLASQLARLKIPFRIIEKNEGPTTQSRALVIADAARCAA
jgi:2-polyprenyl-6-methoxyphenol hydroxylase-like FAD-dependent oxidoreductase